MVARGAGFPCGPASWSPPLARSGSVTARPRRGTVRDVRSPGHRLAAVVLAVITAGAGGCMGEDLDTIPAEPELEPLRLGRVHVVLEPEHDPADEPAAVDDWDAFEVTARFAFVRGLEEDFVRARIDMPVLPSDVIAPGSCMASDHLSAAEQSESPRDESLRELLLVDVGDLRMQIGSDTGSSFEVPMWNVPNLLPYMTGHEYLYYSEDLPPALADATAGGGASVVVESQGWPSADLPAFRAEGVVPPALALHVTESDLYELRRGALVLRWQGAAESDDVVTVRVTGLRGGEAIGAELTCVVYDVGQARLSFDDLRALGLVLDAEALRVTVSRLQAASFDAGDFVSSELFVERREELVLPAI